MTIAPDQPAKAADVLAAIANAVTAAGLSPASGGMLQVSTTVTQAGIPVPTAPTLGFLNVGVNGTTALVPAFLPNQFSGAPSPSVLVATLTVLAPISPIAGQPMHVQGNLQYTNGSPGTFQVLVDGTASPLAYGVSGTGYSGTITAPAAGSHTLQVIDTSNNIKTSVIQFTVATAGTVVNAGSLSLTSLPNAVEKTTITVTGTFVYTAGSLGTVNVLVDGTVKYSGVAVTISGTTFRLQITAPAAGAHTIAVVDSSNSGIASTPVSLTTTSAAPTGAYVPAVFNPASMSGQDFTTVPANSGTSAINAKVWNNVFTNSNTPGVGFWFSGTSDGLWITSSNNSTAVANQFGKWSQSGMMQAETGPSAGFGYGTFHWRARSGQVKQGPGINLILWRGDGGWIDPKFGAQYTEIDVAEAWGFDGTSVSTLHWYDSTKASSGYNGQVFHGLKFPAGTDNTAMHDYDLVWQAGSLALYVDGLLQYNDTSSHVPVDYAHGDCNRTLGFQVVVQSTMETLPTIQMMVANCWWSASTTPPKSGTASVGASPAPSASTVAPTSLALAYPAGTSFSTGGTVQITITAGNGAAAAGSTVYYARWNGGATTDNYSNNPVVLDANGTATITPTPQATGDYYVVVGQATAPYLPISTPNTLLTLQNGPPPVGATPGPTGLTVTYASGSTLAAPGFHTVNVSATNGAAASGATVYAQVFNGSMAYGNFSQYPITLDASGNGSVSLYFNVTGDYPEVVASLTDYTIAAAGPTITIT